MAAVSTGSTWWAGRRVLVTGHTGFKGSWLCLCLHALGAEVFGFADSVPTTPSMFELADVSELVRSRTGDVSDPGSISTVVNEVGPDVVAHLAAQPLVRRSYLEPQRTYEVNVMGTVNLLEAVRRAGRPCTVLTVTSDKCYENRNWDWGYRENEALGGRDPYSSSKGCAELVARAYRDSFFGDPTGIVLASARAGNVIGGGDFAEDRIVPDLVRAALEGRPALVRNPAAVRPWQHVLDCLGGYLLLVEEVAANPALAGAWNFGPGGEDVRSVRTVADGMASRWGHALRWEQDGGVAPHEDRALTLDSAKARSRLGWRPRWDLEAALDHTVAWYRAYEDGGDLRAVSLAQIEAHATATVTR